MTTPSRTQQKNAEGPQRSVPTAEFPHRQRRAIVGAVAIMSAAWILFTYALCGHRPPPKTAAAQRYWQPEIVRLTDGRMAVLKCRTYSAKDGIYVYTVSILDQ